jgi:hypothetical protein
LEGQAVIGVGKDVDLRCATKLQRVIGQVDQDSAQGVVAGVNDCAVLA